ncbi:hypothetical protein, partial [Ideonella sp. B508-1]|uniref:hypothetical protein n=1 Tax=Ideonella sp. B508-1 TaxID=137716 RepID=UPI001F2EF9C6
MFKVVAKAGPLGVSMDIAADVPVVTPANPAAGVAAVVDTGESCEVHIGTENRGRLRAGFRLRSLAPDPR